MGKETVGGQRHMFFNKNACPSIKNVNYCENNERKGGRYASIQEENVFPVALCSHSHYAGSAVMCL
jgi:hypothetical protein